MDQLINPSNDTSVSHPSIDLSNYTSLNNTSLSDNLTDYTSLGYLPIDLSNDNPQIDLLNDLSHPQLNYSTSNNSSIDLSSDTSLNSPPDNTSLSHPSIDLSNNTSLSYPPIDQTKELTSLNYPTQNTLKPEIKKCLEYNKEEKFANEMHVIRHPYHKEATVTLSGNKVIDDFIISILSNSAIYKRRKLVNLEFVPYERFKNIKFVAEGGFSKIYKAIWIDGPLTNKWNYKKKEFNRKGGKTVALKELNNSKNIESKELNELKIFYNFILKHTRSDDTINDTNRYFGITQNPNTQNFMIITNYYKSGDLTHYISKDFFNISWNTKLYKLSDMIRGLRMLHNEGVVHQDYHSRRPFWDRSHDTELIIEICDGLRPPIVTNAPKGYIELMQKCWHSDPHERPSANCIRNEFCYDGKLYPEKESKNPTKIINSPDIGPVTTNNAGAIFKSRPLSTMIKSANFTRSLRLKGQNAASGLDKRKFNNNLIENNNNDKDKIHKRLKYCEEQNDNYLTQELEFDIKCNTNSNKSEDNDYITSELNFDI
ncbi:kinase-like domain-containing protein [Rhizophagus irregularis DAOM 181602=DAOM 197198]|nr:kinase-like domain-containing protein [Rhizophagus irregularis DAOM 181602=DAOM 197198]